MKVRVRVGRWTGCLELEGEKPTLGELRAKLSASLLPSLGYSSDAVFGISLNGRDTITEGEKTLESCDIIPGDLIYLLMPASQLANAAPLPVPQPTAEQRQAADSAQPRNMAGGTRADRREELRSVVQDLPESPRPSTSCYGASVADVSAVEAETSGSLLEPMLVSESVDGKIPHSLESLYLSAGCTTANDALMVAIHLLMLETGYVVQGIAGKAASMPDNWHHSDGVYRLHYTHPLGGESSAVLTCLPMGRLLIVNVTLTVNQGVKCAKRLQLPTHSYIRFPGQENDVGSVFGDLQKLSRVVKDQLVYPFLAATRQALELPDVFGLLVLPPELKLRIFRLLGIQSLVALSSTCRQLRADTDDPSLWKFLYRRDFKDRSSRSPQTKWKELYIGMYEARLQQLHRQRFPLIPPRPFHVPIFFPEPFHPELLFPPGIIGGEYDQRPVLPLPRDPLSRIIPGRQPAMDPFQPVRPPFPGHPNLQPRRRDGPGSFMPSFL